MTAQTVTDKQMTYLPLWLSDLFFNYEPTLGCWVESEHDDAGKVLDDDALEVVATDFITLIPNGVLPACLARSVTPLVEDYKRRL